MCRTFTISTPSAGPSNRDLGRKIRCDRFVQMWSSKDLRLDPENDNGVLTVDLYSTTISTSWEWGTFISDTGSGLSPQRLQALLHQ